MKIELKTDNDYFTKSFLYIFFSFVIISLIIIVINISMKLGNISKNSEIVHLCRLLAVDKSPSNFKKLSNLTNLKSRSKIWELCRGIVK